MLERDGIAHAHPSRSISLFDRVIQTYGDSAFGHHALEEKTANGHLQAIEFICISLQEIVCPNISDSFTAFPPETPADIFE